MEDRASLPFSKVMEERVSKTQQWGGGGAVPGTPVPFLLQPPSGTSRYFLPGQRGPGWQAFFKAA